MTEDEFDEGWTAFQVHDGVWSVRFRYRSRGRAQQAVWELDVDAGRLVSRDRLASDLGYVDKVRKRRVIERTEGGEPAAEAEAIDTVPRPQPRRRSSRPVRRPPTTRAAARATKARRASAPAARRAGARDRKSVV
jgi:hypothetical protein